MIVPDRSVVNCERPAPVSVATIGAIQSVRIAASAAISKMLIASEKYRKEATGLWHANSFAIFLFGQNQYGRRVIGILTETFGGAAGARTFADGVDVGGLITNPISRMANIETLESSYPVRYLFRRRRIDLGGPGQYRGGTGMEMAIVPHDAPDGGIQYVISGKGQKHAMTDGLGGGYPGARNRYIWVHRSSDGAETVPAASWSVDAFSGPKEEVSWGVYSLMGHDALYVAWNGGGGYGDPLRRDPNSVLRNVRDYVVSREVARLVYGTVISDKLEVDPVGTAELRQNLIAQRRQRTINI